MAPVPPTRRWRGPQLAAQILGLLIGGLVVAQLVTLLLTMLLPPAPTPQYALDDIAMALRGGRPAGGAGRELQRIVQAGPPDIAGPGWLVSERSRADLARLLDTGPEDVALAFYTPLPFAGVAAAPAITLRADDGPVRPLAALAPLGGMGGARLILADAVVPTVNGLAMPRLARPPGGESRFGPPPRDALPPGIALPEAGMQPGTRPRTGMFPADAAARGAAPRERPAFGNDRPLTRGEASGLYRIDPTSAAGGTGLYIPGDGGVAVPPLLRGDAAAFEAARAAAEARLREGQPGQPLREPPFGLGAARIMPVLPSQQTPLLPSMDSAARAPLTIDPALTAPQPSPRTTAEPRAPEAAPAAPGRTAPLDSPQAMPRLQQPALTPAPSLPSEPPAGPPIAIQAPGRSLFGLAPAPFVEGDFVAALRLADGRWSVVQPAAEPFPNAWQRRLILWFAISFAIVAPLGWLFARRLSKPLGQFAAAAERLGRDPAATVMAIDGPAEIGRAAHAFNLMQTRLRSFVDDRTAMIGAISHDLRTPLTRMRFRIEDVPDEAREGLLEEVEEMEAMITSVLEFIRDASSPGLRERLDLRTLLDDVVEDAVMVGNDVAVEEAQSATVDIDVLGMRRVLDNLLENAVKYGSRARVRLRAEAQNAIAEIIDDGPGLPDEELERVFEPFYRSEAARSSDKAGNGLGLAVCRSIARAHGGDVRLLRSKEGFLAQVRVPLAYDSDKRPLAA